ncbi:MAG: acyl-CoA carboxylase subunit beta [Phycisphaerales bacterium]|nr:acyl-CoA carboxylase subunit beta [Phycisphaerales bacterium]
MGGGPKAVERQHEKGRLTARERIALLVDRAPQAVSAAVTAQAHSFQELGLWAAHDMYVEHGGAPAAGVVTGIGLIHGRRWMVIANDATVKAGAFFPMTCKKIIRAQTIAQMARMPLVYLVDSAGVFLPLQEDVFPDADDFGRIFRNNAVLSAEGIPQIAAIMGYCVAGGGYLPVLCDTLLMTEGSGLYLAGPALVKAAIGQQVSDEELGGAAMHAGISGTIDFKERDDEACLARVRSLIAKYGAAGDCAGSGCDPRAGETSAAPPSGAPTARRVRPAFHDPAALPSIFTDAPGRQYDVKAIIACLVDACAVPNGDGSSQARGAAFQSLAPDFDEYKAEYGQSLVCGYARIGGHACGIVANQKMLTTRQVPGGKAGPGKSTNMPGVIYDDSADKAARFIMDCNQRRIPLVFLHDTTGFMVGRDSEQGGIIRAGAKMVNAMSNCIVPKIVVILGGSYGAGNYAMCGRAFDQFLSFAWPNARCAVMGANQATGTLATIEEAARKRRGEEIDEATHKQILGAIHAGYTEQADIRHAAARGWVDRLILPEQTRDELIAALAAANQGWDYAREFRTGVLQT